MTPIETLGLGDSIERALLESGFDSVEKVLNTSADLILALKGINHEALTTINNTLKRQGVAWQPGSDALPVDEVIAAAIAYKRACGKFLRDKGRQTHRSLVLARVRLRKHFPSLSDVELHRFAEVIVQAGSIGLRQALHFFQRTGPRTKVFIEADPPPETVQDSPQLSLVLFPKRVDLPVQTPQGRLSLKAAVYRTVKFGEVVSSREIILRFQDKEWQLDHRLDWLTRALRKADFTIVKRVGQKVFFRLKKDSSNRVEHGSPGSAL